MSRIVLNVKRRFNAVVVVVIVVAVIVPVGFIIILILKFISFLDILSCTNHHYQYHLFLPSPLSHHPHHHYLNFMLNIFKTRTDDPNYSSNHY